LLSSPKQLPPLPFRPLIIHNDLDGLLSYLFLREKGYELAGVYDLETLYMKPGVRPADCLAVDLDISHPLIPSIGHHFLLFSAESHINMNMLFGVSTPENVSERMKRAFVSKCPVPTALFLHWLTGTPLPADPLRQAWLVYADSLHESYRKYAPNVTRWLLAMGYGEILHRLSSDTYAPHFRHIVDVLSRFGFSPTTQKPFPQCRFSPSRLPSLLPFLQVLAREMGFRSVDNLPAVQPRLQGARYSLRFHPGVFEALGRKFREWELLSHSLVYHDQVEVTLLVPLSEQSDPVLWNAVRTCLSLPKTEKSPA